MKEVVDYSKFISNFPDYILKAFSFGHLNLVKPGFRRIIVCGMGGSGIAGDVLKCYLQDFEVVVVKDYNIPSYLNDGLVFCVSYSGNTQETLSCYKQAISRNLDVVGISSGGKLAKLCKKNDSAFIKIPTGFLPRFALAFLFFPMLRVLEDVGFDVKHDVYLLTKKLKSNLEKELELARRLIGKIPLIYTSTEYYCCGLRFKEQLNENSKTHAFFNVFSEMNHNEIMGFEDARFFPVYLDFLNNKKITKRFKVFKKMFVGQYIVFKSSNKLLNIFSAILFSDWISYYLANLRKIDVGEMKAIEKFKMKI